MWGWSLNLLTHNQERYMYTPTIVGGASGSWDGWPEEIPFSKEYST
jgi:hypothetical protein